MSDCPFCKYQNNGKKLDYQNEYFYIVVPREPAMYGHVLVVSKNQDDKHVEDIADPKLSQKQLKSMIVATQILSKWMKKELCHRGKHVEKVYVLTECDNENSHFHFHLKPRYANEETGDVFLCLKELEEARWTTEDSQTTNRNLEGFERLQRIELGLCKHRNMIKNGRWTRGNQERKAFIGKIEKRLNRLLEELRSELDAIGE